MDLEPIRVILIIELWSLLRLQLLFVLALPIALFVIVIFSETALGRFFVNIDVTFKIPILKDSI